MKFRTDHLKFDDKFDDATTGVYFGRQLELITAQVYQQKFPAIKYPGLITVNTEGDLGVSSIVDQLENMTGLAKFMGNDVNDIELADVIRGETITPIHPIGTAFSFTTLEIARAVRSNYALSARKAIASRRSVENKLNKVVWFGETKIGIYGMLNLPGITTAAVATGTGGYLWSQKTAAELLVDLNSFITLPQVATLGTITPNTILLPLAQYNIIKNLPMNAAGAADKTVLMFFKENNLGVRLDWILELETAHNEALSDDVALVFNSQEVELKLPAPLTYLSPQQHGYRTTTYGLVATGGIFSPVPSAISVYTGI